MVLIFEIFANHKWEEKDTIYLIFVGKGKQFCEACKKKLPWER